MYHPSANFCFSLLSGFGGKVENKEKIEKKIK